MHTYPSLSLSRYHVCMIVSPKAVLIDTREPMEVPGATVEVIASTSSNNHCMEEMESYLVKKKSKHPYRQELLLRYGPAHSCHAHSPQ